MNIKNVHSDKKKFTFSSAQMTPKKTSYKEDLINGYAHLCKSQAVIEERQIKVFARMKKFFLRILWGDK
jgi:hypothetical protein